MDARRLLIFRAVAHAGSLAGAARALGWTQPAVSQHVSTLERECGHPLLLRRHDGVVLTDAGRLLAARADAVAATLSLATQEQADIARLASGSIRLAAFPSAAASVVPAALSRLRRQAPALKVRFVEAEPPQARMLLERDEIDAALVFSYDDAAPPAGLASRPICTDPVRLVTPRDQPPVRRRPQADVTPADLVEAQWIAGCDQCRAHLHHVTSAAGYEPKIVHATDDYVATQHLVAAGLGIALLPQAALDAFTHPGVMTDDNPCWGARHITILYHDGAATVPAIAALLRSLETL